VATPKQPPVLIVMGPMGCGKTTVGRLLADRLGRPFIDADDFHPPANVAKMQRGIALTDADRRPWLETLAAEIAAWRAEGRGGILACSALKQSYRDLLGIDQQAVRTVFLQGSFDLLYERIAARRDHYMNPGLLQSQLDTLEPPKGGITVDITPSPATIAERIIHQLDEKDNQQ
jgi:carbohydrate kinase (thermoresistant glucokinase family)